MITTKHAPFKVRDTPSVPVEMRRRSKHLWLRMCLASIFGLLPIAASSDEALTINVIVSLTGPAAFVGTDEKNGLQVYESVVNRSGGVRGRPVHFQFLDDTSSPQVTVQLVSGLIEKHVPIFLGPVTTGPCAAAEALVHNAGPVEFCFSPGLQTPKGGFAFAAAQAAEVMAVAQGRFMTDKGYNRVALLVTTDASGQFGSTAIINTLKMYPALQIVDVERFSPTALSISAQIEKLKTFNPQVIFTIAIGPAFGRFCMPYTMRALMFRFSGITATSTTCSRSQRHFSPRIFTLTAPSSKPAARRDHRRSRKRSRPSPMRSRTPESLQPRQSRAFGVRPASSFRPTTSSDRMQLPNRCTATSRIYTTLLASMGSTTSGTAISMGLAPIPSSS